LKAFYLAFITVAAFITDTSLAEVEVIRDKVKGKVISVEASPGTPLPNRALRLQATIDPVALAAEQIALHGTTFGVTDPKDSLKLEEVKTDSLGMHHVRLSQVFKGVPVYGDELIVHLKANGTLRSINGSFVPNISVATTPTLQSEEALKTASSYFEAKYQGAVAEASEPKLWVINPSLVRGEEPGESVLSWEVKVRDLTKDKDETVFVDAETGEVVFEVSNVRNQTRREVYDCSNTALGCVIDTHDPTYDYIFGRSEGQPVRGINPILQKAQDDLLYDRLEVVRRYY